MNWRTDKPTANVIVAKFNNIYEILNRDEQGNYCLQDGFVKKFVLTSDIEKWADLEEEETVTDCKELEKEIDRVIDDLEGVAEKSSDGELIAHLTPIEHLKGFARHFAKWGAEHLKNKQK